MYLNGLDELDQKIIQLLIENARISYSDIGERNRYFQSGSKSPDSGSGEKRHN